jgi:hypothetical protein
LEVGALPASISTQRLRAAGVALVAACLLILAGLFHAPSAGASVDHDVTVAATACTEPFGPPTGEIAGSVTNTYDYSVVYTVNLTGPSLAGRTLDLQANETGSFVFTDLPGGDYAVIVETPAVEGTTPTTVDVSVPFCEQPPGDLYEGSISNAGCLIYEGAYYGVYFDIVLNNNGSGDAEFEYTLQVNGVNRDPVGVTVNSGQPYSQQLVFDEIDDNVPWGSFVSLAISAEGGTVQLATARVDTSTCENDKGPTPTPTPTQEPTPTPTTEPTTEPTPTPTQEPTPTPTTEPTTEPTPTPTQEPTKPGKAPVVAPGKPGGGSAVPPPLPPQAKVPQGAPGPKAAPQFTPVSSTPNGDAGLFSAYYLLAGIFLVAAGLLVFPSLVTNRVTPRRVRD